MDISILLSTSRAIKRAEAAEYVSVRDLVNQMVLDRASRDEYRMALFAMLAGFYWSGTLYRMSDIREFAQLTAIDTVMFNEIREAAMLAFV